MIPLTPERSAFGRHETFPLRFGWLTKGVGAWLGDPTVFDNDDAIVKLGVGKNMVDAIRYWMTASQIVTVKGRSLEPTAIGKAVFYRDGWDPYLEDDSTIWLVHWLIASNPAEATTPFWFFNRFHKPEFTSKELQDALGDFVREHLQSRATAATLQNDIALLLRMYESSHTSKSTPIEEALDSPMALLDLISHQEGTKIHESRPEYRARLPLPTFAFAVAQLFEQTNEPVLPVDRLLHSNGYLASPGAVFRITEECLVAKLEAMIAWLPGRFELRQTAGIHQLYRLAPMNSLDVLKFHYEGTQRGGRA
ncbi:MAG: DUF4007 family protein [Burkholderiales bacterium]